MIFLCVKYVHGGLLQRQSHSCVTGFVKTVPISTTIEIHFMA